MFELTGRVVLVTGAGQGVGEGIATAMAAQGASVAVNDLVGKRAEQVLDRLLRAGARACAGPADVTDLDAVRAMVADVERRLGPVDVLVNNAGIPSTGVALRPFVDTSPSEWRPFVDINLYGVLHCTHAVLPGMKARKWGRIISVTSDAGRSGEANLAVYAASKAAGAAFTRSVAKEVGRDGITCNSISLGTIASRAAEPGESGGDVSGDDGSGDADAERLARQLRRYPVGRLGRPSDVAAAAVWLASEEASWVTGQTISVNGGYATT